ncbi:YihY/virulence factor BrkB family protein [Corynebacterium kalidii]|uniref:YihY/virulence factor BrkB family protein n=1 Tax=Corynebacterium kalidii TaxID=2931982 RepID=A0A9X1WFG5_9CORY|nr:YihY/virulence factor BrkB family protein [Corynebacterium kalidii]
MTIDVSVHSSAPAWRYVPGRSFRRFLATGCIDLAGSLAFRTLLALFPALIALVSILGLFGQSEESVVSMLDEAERVVPASAWGAVEPVLQDILNTSAAGLGLFIGLLTTLWTASGYVKTFGRAMNSIYGAPEGRGLIKYNVQMYLLTAFLLVLMAFGFVALGVSGPIAEMLGSLVGLQETTLRVWGVARWGVIAVVVILFVGLLYRTTPNIRVKGMWWVSPGAVLAIAGAVLASVVFFFYVVNFGNYSITYGALAGVVILMLWLFIVNIVLLFGAVVDSEVERVRQLKAGLPAEESLQVETRDTVAIEKAEEQLARDMERARTVREAAESAEAGEAGDDSVAPGDPAARPAAGSTSSD